ncbi:MAG: hypothetical protein QOI38_2387 [Sphingomonadales bacterium]|jgi:hypothetical protein|nr:hypothetical protein [Sphingomonadales bacterium]
MARNLRFVILCAALSLAAPAAGQSTMGRCGFDRTALKFRGTDVEQARCLLSPVRRVGVLGPIPERLGPFLEANIGRPAAVDRTRLRNLLNAERLQALAATVDAPVSRARNNAPGAPFARYFVIHDTSQLLRGSTFPPNDDLLLNGLGTRGDDGNWVAHTFTNRRGEVLLAHDYRVPWRAVRLERTGVTGGGAKGLFLHNEVNQPRLGDPNGPAGNDRIAPEPGFTAQQYDRLALLYILASTRAGRWMIPAYHAVLDSGISGGHDDPQNFVLESWEAAIARRVAQLSEG